MKLIFRYIYRYRGRVSLTMAIKLFGTFTELTIPYILEHLIDNVVPLGEIGPILFWGLLMMVAAGLTRFLNVTANRSAVVNAHNISYGIRQALFEKTIHLSGSQFDRIGLPSLTSRMTSDSYNIQSFSQSFQALLMRAPILMLGGIAVTSTMDPGLAMILICMVPVMIVVSIGVSKLGIPLYRKVQDKLDTCVRVMRENITGIRVVKALSKTSYEKGRFEHANDSMAKSDIHASTVMAIPGPFMQMCLNIGLALVVLIGAHRVNSGTIRPGVILAFLTYFNMILQGVLGLNRIFILLSKATASANRISEILELDEEPKVIAEADAAQPKKDAFISFEHVDFSYVKEGSSDSESFAGGERAKCLSDISFSLNRGESLGIIGPTGCGKTTIINLLMRYYDADEGGVFIDGRDVRTYTKRELHSLFGAVFQNDMIFFDTLRENILFGRELSDDAAAAAIDDAAAREYIDSVEGGLDYKAEIGGANLSGGQKQRILIARALASNPEILVLDDSSSALDYRTDAALRKAIFENHASSTVIMVAQRISSIQNMTKILVMEDGRAIGYGKHSELLKTCPGYKDIYDAQMGSLL